MNLPQDIRNELLDLIAGDRKRDAIRRLQEATGINLVDATRQIEQLAKEAPSGATSPGIKRRIPINLLLFGALFELVGIVFLAVTIWHSSGTLEQFERNSISVDAVVVGFKGSFDGQAPVFQYRYGEETYQHESNIYSNPPAYEKDETVELLIDPNNPSDPLVNSFSEIWLLPLIFGFLGSVFFLIGSGVLISVILTSRQ